MSKKSQMLRTLSKLRPSLLFSLSGGHTWGQCVTQTSICIQGSPGFRLSKGSYVQSLTFIPVFMLEIIQSTFLYRLILLGSKIVSRYIAVCTGVPYWSRKSCYDTD